MNEPIAPQLPDARSHVGHETTDASAYYVGLFALALAVTIALSLLLLYRLFWRLETRAQRSDPVASPVADEPTVPEPRLQVDPRAELARLRAEEDEMLRNYQWIDQQHGIVQIPIQRAIDLLSERGLPEPRAATPTVPPETTP
jgi:hypothetical protein